MIVACPKCHTKYRVDETKIPDAGLKLRCTKCTSIFLARKPAAAPAAAAPPPKAQVLVANAELPYLQELTDQIRGAGYAVYQTQDGASALAAIKSKRPQVAIVDVALPGVFGFQISEPVK